MIAPVNPITQIVRLQMNLNKDLISARDVLKVIANLIPSQQTHLGLFRLVFGLGLQASVQFSPDFRNHCERSAATQN
jgi:hypothetical protein